MPNVGPNFESSGNKKDKPEKAELDTETAGDVPAGTRSLKNVKIYNSFS